MSGIYLPNMEMPTSCMLCPFCVEEADPANGEMCMVTGTLMPPCTRERLDNCPLVFVPEHGRLIDADALKAWFVEWYDMNAELEIRHVIDIITDANVAPTIIPADKEGEG